MKAYGSSFKLLKKLGLWKYFGIPMLISFITASAIGFLAWSLSDTIGGWIAKAWVWQWGSETFHSISNFIGGLLIVVLGFMLYKHIVLALSAPFMSVVSEKIEAHILSLPEAKSQTSFKQQLWRGIKINIRNLMMELFYSIPVILIGFIPVIGIVSSVVLFIIQSYYAGFGNMDYTLERHFSYKESIKLVRNNSGLAIGNGILFMVMLLLPVIGIILVLPLSVTAASLTTVQLIQSKKK